MSIILRENTQISLFEQCLENVGHSNYLSSILDVTENIDMEICNRILRSFTSYETESFRITTYR